jgi:hypothetical protein
LLEFFQPPKPLLHRQAKALIQEREIHIALVQVDDVVD